MSNEKTKYQLLLERLGNNPALKEQALSATPEQFAALCREHGLKEITLDRAETLQKRLKETFDATTGALSDDQLAAAAGGGFCECGSFGDVFC